MSSVWSDRFSHSTNQVTSSIIRDLLKLTEQPALISFAGGLPAPECFPAAELAAASERATRQTPLAALQYGPTEGYAPLRGLIAERMQRLGMAVSGENVLVTSGSQQALDLLGRLMIDPGAPILVEDPSYLGAIQAWRPLDPRFVTVPVDDEGLDVDALEALLAGGLQPRFLYTISSFQNPTGVTLTPPRRRRLIELAARYRLPIIEDDPYGEIIFSGQRSSPLAVLDAELHGELRHVVYVSTFSKLLAPGLRLGWTIAPPALRAKIAHTKQGFDLHTGSLAQATVYEACRDGLLDRHIPRVCTVYRERRDYMLAALHEHMPSWVQWTEPQGGMFVWLTLPTHIDTTSLFRLALEYEVAFVPGGVFFANGGGTNTMRLNFSLPSAEQISTGIARLGRMINAVPQEMAA